MGGGLMMLIQFLLRSLEDVVVFGGLGKSLLLLKLLVALCLQLLQDLINARQLWVIFNCGFNFLL